MDSNGQIKRRDEIPTEYKWALEDLFGSDSAWEQELSSLAEDQAKLSAFCGRLGVSAQNLYDYLVLMEQVHVKIHNLAHYCMRKADEDTRDATYQAMTGKFVGATVAMDAACSFETPEIMAIEEATLKSFFAHCPELERYRRYLNNLRRRMAHVLTPAEEKLLAATGEMAQTPDKIYGLLADADMTFSDALDCDGNAHPVTQGTFIKLQENSDRELRESAYNSLYTGFEGLKNTAAGLLDAQNKQLKFYADARKYTSAFEASLDSTNVPTSVYLSLIDSVHRNAEKMHRYIRMRKKLLGLEKMYFYDIYTPLVKNIDKNIPFENAKQTVYDALAPLGEGYRSVLKTGFENRWIDVYQNEGKRSGAYSAGAAVHPYVLLNYTGTLDSQFTLAHEMGHALHSYLSNKHQNPVDAGYVIFVAEVASICNEALLMAHLLSGTQDGKERAYLINHFLDQFKGTLFRQTMFAEFELNIGKMVAEGKTLTSDVLCDEYRRLNEQYYGPDIVVDHKIAMEWARIPHFYYDYYVFQYATGFAAAIALSRRILTGEENAVSDYLRFLSAGCTKSPIELLKDAGVDMTTTEPIDRAMELFDSLLNEMEELMEV